MFEFRLGPTFFRFFTAQNNISMKKNPTLSTRVRDESIHTAWMEIMSGSGPSSGSIEKCMRNLSGFKKEAEFEQLEKGMILRVSYISKL